MSEANYPETQDQMGFTDNLYLAQTFTPRESHESLYATVKLYAMIPPHQVEVALQYTTPAGWPTGIDLAVHKIGQTWLEFYPPPRTHQCKIEGVRIVAGIGYALVLRIPPAYVYETCHAVFEPPPGHYPRGKLIRSLDQGHTWDTTDLGDLFFAEWGNPPLTPIKTDPPLNNFAVIDLAYTHWDIGLVIRVPTNVPCHLTCYCTDKQPGKHQTSRIVRGVAMPWHTYFCFVAWHVVEQSEYGSTLYHTFDFPDWKEGQTRWFTFKGEVDLQDVPSVGPIFKHTHPGGSPRYLPLYPIAPGDLTRIWNQTPITGQHWDKVDDIIPDEDATIVWMAAYWNGKETDLYTLTTPPAGLGKIERVTIYARWRRQGGYAYFIDFWHKLKTHGAIYTGPPYQSGGSYQTIAWVHPTNPFTGDPWTQAELATLQAGITLETYLGVGTASSGICTQVYALVTRGINGGPD